MKKEIGDWVDSIIRSIDARFNIDNALKQLLFLFDPQNLKAIKKDDLQTIEKYKETVEIFKSRFSEKWYNEKEDDWRIFMEHIHSHINQMKTVGDVCNYILKTPQFANTITLIRLAHIIKLIPPTTVPVEAAFSILNTILTKQRNSLKETTLNFIMMIKINFEENDVKQLLSIAADKWIEKKRRNIGEVLNFLGLKKRVSRTKIENDLDEEVDDDSHVYSGLNLSVQIEKEKTDFKDPNTTTNISSVENVQIQTSDIKCTSENASNLNQETKMKNSKKSKSTWETEASIYESFRNRKRRFVEDI
jgi:hypothetical protein